MLSELKLLHAYLGGLIQEADAGALVVDELYHTKDDRSSSITLSFVRVHVLTGCDHQYRRIASGEYECRVPGCGAITDEPEGEQWN
jgi:hypothetical protein